MRTQSPIVKTHAGTVRAGVISLLVFAVGYLWLTGLSDLPKMWLFIISFAVCFVLMMQSVVELLVLGFGTVARYSGMGLGRAMRIVRRVRLRASAPV